MLPSAKISDFDYELPQELIAQYPLSNRSSSRLITVDAVAQKIIHQQFKDILDILKPQDLLIFNDTKVLPSRFFGEKMTGGKIECLIERILSPQTALVHLRASKAPKDGTVLIFAEGLQAEVIGRQGRLFELRFHTDQSILDWLHTHGRIPLPPYIQRKPDTADADRYQTVYAAKEGAVAAPTAGLHFDRPLIDALKNKGIETAYVTLHIGAGTFQPVKTEDLDQHVMHSEYMEVSQNVCDAVLQCKKNKGRVIAVGTSVLRSLETASLSGKILPSQGETELFIRPGFQFHTVDGLVTNLHLPQSTLLVLVATFAGYHLMKQAYQEAIAQKYRFYSYGDAMLILR